MSEGTKQGTILAATFLAFALGIGWIISVANDHADEQRTQMEIACVKSHQAWDSDYMSCGVRRVQP